MTRQQSPRGRANAGRPRRSISVRSVRRDPADYRKVARALIALVEAQAAAEAKKRQETPGTTEDAA